MQIVSVQLVNVSREAKTSHFVIHLAGFRKEVL